MRRDRGRRAEPVDPADPVSRLLSRASTIAAAVALVSLGLAYVASHAGWAGDTTLAGGVAEPDAGRQMMPFVPAVLSPEVAPASFTVEVTVRPDPVAPAAPVPVPVSDAQSRDHTGREQLSPPHDATGEPAPDGPPAPDSPRDRDRDRDPGRGPDADDGWDDWRDWWNAQSDEWDRAWRAALEREWSRDAGEWDRGNDPWRHSRDRGRGR